MRAYLMAASRLGLRRSLLLSCASLIPSELRRAMAEVTVWIEQDGSRVSYTAESADKYEAMRGAWNFLDALLGQHEADAELDEEKTERASPVPGRRPSDQVLALLRMFNITPEDWQVARIRQWFG